MASSLSSMHIARLRTQATSLLRSAVAGFFVTQMAMPAGLSAQMTAQANAPAVGLRENAAAGGPLSNDERILHVLNRFTYGPRPGDLERVRAMGLSAWFTQQLSPQTIDDSALEARLSAYPAMRLPLAQLMEMYPNQGMVRATMNGRMGIPSGETEKAIYNDQMARQKAKKDRKNQAIADGIAPLPADQVQAVLALPPDKRFSALCKMKPAELRGLRQSLNEDQRQHLTDGFTPQQIESLAAFNSPQAVVAAEDIQTKLLRDIYTERQLNELMVDFWLNHFNVYMRKSQQAPYYIASYERDVIRPRALGQFEDLLVAVASSPAMLNYLDNASSIGPHSAFATWPQRGFRNPNANKKATGLNENYARELMELHTVGVNGGYTQHDVTEVAKVFTGWTIGTRRPGSPEAVLAEYDWTKHEPGSKQVLGTTIKESGEKEGLQVLHMLATSPKTARFISTKLAVRFVSDDPPQAMVDRMAKTFLNTNGDIRRVLLAMVNSTEFFAPQSYRAKVKTPQEFVASAVRASGVDVESPGALVNVVADLGMPLYGMQTPNGYSMKADAWNNTAALVERMNFALALASNRVAGVMTNWPAMLGNPSEPLGPEATAALLEDKLLHQAVSERTKQTILTQISSDREQQEASLRQVAVKNRNRDPLAIAGGRRPEAMATVDPTTALAAGLLFGSPEFQRR
ncbi:DUF1800 domain-containing protein [Edaphobacter bradus]|uniref:DUF1800 domain-containing protein n=1 Tax=Edaphobacter bradus TaxID=2259016 RepID=UPI0021E048B0|nr:DUF1800 domain-containing protein [Edaphobacter bradus]